jgi:hypothetical protein
MKKLIMTSLLASAVIVNVSAQWLPGTGIITTTNKVGVGNTTPNNPLSVKGTGTGTVEVGQIAGSDGTVGVNGAIGFCTGVALTRTNSALLGNQAGTVINGPTANGGIFFKINDVNKCTLNNGGFTVETALVATKLIDAQDNIMARKGILILNKAGNGWVDFATRNITGTEAKYDLGNINNMAVKGIATVTNLAVTGTATFANTLSSTGLYGTSTTGKNITFGTGANAANAKMTITEAGNVGIGTATPWAKLEVAGNIANTFGNSIRANNEEFSYDGKNLGHYSSGWILDSSFPSAPSYCLSAFGGIKMFTGGSMKMKLDFWGNVGIGTETPQAKLDVAGDIDVLEQININPTSDGKLSTLRFNNYTPGGSSWAGGSHGFSIVSQQNFDGEEDGLKFMDNVYNPGGEHPKEMMKISTAGNLEVAGGIKASDTLKIGTNIPGGSATLKFENETTGSGGAGIYNFTIQSNGISNSSQRAGLRFISKFWAPGNPLSSGDGSDTPLFIGANEIGIGTCQPQYKLDVKGTIRALEIRVETIDKFADYVFEKNYKLRSLSEVENYISSNGHLPEIPSAEEVKANGVSLVEMQVKLLQKVEELTLYSIKQQKEIEELKAKLDNGIK